MNLTNTWETFLRVPPQQAQDAAPCVDEAWMAAKGVGLDAPAIVCLMRSDVLPLIRNLEQHHFVGWYCFLIHDGASGVPCAPDDKALYVHLRLALADGVNAENLFTSKKLLSRRWEMSRKCKLAPEIAGIEPMMLEGGIERAWRLLGAQSAWYLDFLEAHPDADTLALIKHARQFLHFFANMAQVRVA